MSFISFSSYKDNQVILNSDRVLLNSKKDSVFIISNKTIGLSANDSVHINIGEKGTTDKNKKLIVNSPKIEFGLPVNGNRLEPIAKGDSTKIVLDEILAALKAFSIGLQAATGIGVGVVNLPMLNTSANALSLKIDSITAKVEAIKSKTTYSV